MLQVDLLHHSILGRRARVQSDDHHAQANLPAAKTTIHTMRNRNIETAKLACFLNSLRPSLIRVVRRKNIERTKRKIGIAAAMKAMILKIIVHSQCRVTRSFDHLVGAGWRRAASLAFGAGGAARRTWSGYIVLMAGSTSTPAAVFRSAPSNSQKWVLAASLAIY